jgi:hypothetical protein
MSWAGTEGGIRESPRAAGICRNQAKIAEKSNTYEYSGSLLACQFDPKVSAD